VQLDKPSVELSTRFGNRLRSARDGSQLLPAYVSTPMTTSTLHGFESLRLRMWLEHGNAAARHLADQPLECLVPDGPGCEQHRPLAFHEHANRAL
jgi:hypothetical protein